MSSTGIDETLKLEAVYFSAPIPRNLAVLTVLGAVFDKIYFPGVYMPKEGFDAAELDKEIARLEALPIARDYDTQLLIGVLKLTKHGKTLEGFCEFTATADDPFYKNSGMTSHDTGHMIGAIYEALHGPPKPGFIPTFDTGHCKGLPGGEESVVYPGVYHYFAEALHYSAKTGVPLLNDVPGLPIPGLKDSVPYDDATRHLCALTDKHPAHQGTPTGGKP